MQHTTIFFLSSTQLNMDTSFKGTRYHYMRCLGLIEALNFLRRINRLSSHYGTLLDDFKVHASKVTLKDLRPKSRKRFYDAKEAHALYADFYKSVILKKPETYAGTSSC